MKKLVLNPYTIDPVEHSSNFGLECKDPSLTVQSDVEQTDINYIVKQFGLSHELPYGLQTPEFADYSDIPNDYHAARMFMAEAQDTFMQLPAESRARFDNDPGKLLAFLSDASNIEEARKLGFVEREPLAPAEPSTAPVSPPVTPNHPAPNQADASGG